MDITSITVARRVFFVWIGVQVLAVLAFAYPVNLESKFLGEFDSKLFFGFLFLATLVSIYFFIFVMKSRLRGGKQIFWAFFSLAGFAALILTSPLFYFFVLRNYEEAT